MNDKLEKFSNFVIFQTPKGKVNIDVFFKDDNLWLTQKKIAELFETTKQNISLHLKNIFSDNELEEISVVKDFLTTAEDGKNYKTKFYNLDAIIAVGYRVNSYQATQFRIWATKILKAYTIKGFAMDDNRLKQIKHFGKDYFDELLARIREIRASERRVYQKITDIYALSADYDKNAPTTKDFFATVQNKLHFAITGNTAAEIIYNEADSKKAFMGLKTWNDAPDGKILKNDVSIAKNYLGEKHIKELERIVASYVDLAENRAERGIVTNMQDWVTFLNKFLDISDYPILADKGKVTALKAKLKSESEFEKFRVIQDKNFQNDFDRAISKMEKPKKPTIAKNATTQIEDKN
jgi:hypothetical protein